MKTASDEYISEEESVEREPSEIYHIWDQYNDWYLTDGDTAITVGGIEYSPSTTCMTCFDSFYKIDNVER